MREDPPTPRHREDGVPATPPAGTGLEEDLLRTRWEDVDALVGATDVESRHEAWQRIAERYRGALLLRVRQVLTRRGRGARAADDAEDVLQACLAESYEKRWFERADPRRGRLRDFLRVIVTRYARGVLRREGSARRQPRHGRVVALEHPGELPGPQLDLGATFEAEWVACLLRAALVRVEARSAAAASVLRDLWANGSARAPTAPPLSGQAKVARHRARAMLAEEFWAEVRRTVATAEELREEQAALAPYLAPYLGIAWRR